jgi:DNA-binding FrmR family transcriptional regulator
MKSETIGGKVILRRTTDEKVPFMQRLARIEGQVRGLRQMIEDDRYCGEELQQVNAVIAAIREVALLLISEQMTSQINHMAEEPAGAASMQDLIELLRSTFRLQ